ncbi:hypothetical protein LJB88_04575 [Erysipelotrichaceae bacterium OttesenSCG-928-M19]|nr:hypothetical protein [Erysipelotrichaceae bacterium OttesenSCG-928-M19]
MSQTVKKEQQRKINKIGKYKVKSTFRTAVIYQDEFGEDLVEEVSFLQNELSGELNIKLSLLGYIKVYYALVATAEPKWLEDGMYDKFLDENDLSSIYDYAPDIIECALVSFDDGGSKK